MTSFIERFVHLPMPVKGVIILATGGGILAAADYFLGRRALYVLIIGLAFVAALLVGYRFLLKWFKKRKAAPMERAISSNTSSAPQGISDPARRAALDSLRKAFDGGVEKFKAAGKNLYSLPWYALVGESGSGKTEAIRHCNVGFPPGLQDQLQGVGGTINMNWWFTNHAVILDTAGRLMFEEVEPGSTSEWQEFLKLLRKNRPNCPINGMLLVIPAESLIRDTADQLEKKGGKIAQQLDNIQRALGVRFPVFVVVTKCDLINGFREFFDTLKDPQLQHQILGWSNPGDLDEPFNPELVEQHLQTVQQRLSRRRLGLLLDPVHTEDPGARRTEQVDALYAFPEALIKIAPRLRRYLEMIFVAGEWSAKPLFLRGIYFTSSMREGSALDADLAEALGRPIESLPEGRIWERDRAYFLRDLFMHKVFKEKGLVTRAGNTRQQQRKRRALVYGTAAAGLVLVGLFTWLGWRGLRESINGPRDFWTEATRTYAERPQKAYIPNAPSYLLPIIYPGDEPGKYHYRDPQDETIRRGVTTAPREERTAGRFPNQLAEQARRTIHVPLIFYPVNLLTGSLDRNFLESERADAARAILEASVLRPLLDVARQRMAADVAAGSWSADAGGALRQLLRIEVAALENNRSSRPVEVAPLLRYALAGTDDYAKVAAQETEALQSAIDWLHDPGRSDLWALRLAAREGGGLQAAARAFASSWSGATGSDDPLGMLTAMAAALEALADAERTLHAVDNQAAGAPSAAIQAWNDALALVRGHAAAVERGLPALRDRTLARAYEEELSRRRQDLEQGMLAELAPLKPGENGRPAVSASSSDADKSRWETLNAVRTLLGELLVDSEAQLARQSRMAQMDTLFLSGGPSKDWLFRARLEMYSAADAQLNPASPTSGLGFGAVRPALDSLEAAIQSAESIIANRLPATSAAPEAGTLRSEAMGVSRFALQLAGRSRRAALIADFLSRAPTTGPEFAAAVEQIAAGARQPLSRPSVPMTRMASETSFDRRFNPQAAAALLGDAWAVSRALVSAPDGGEPAVLNARDLQTRFGPVRTAADAYAEIYMQYWSKGRIDDLAVIDARWTEFASALAPYNQPSSFNAPLADLADVIVEAVRAVEGFLPAGAVSAEQVRADASRSKEALLRNESRISTQRSVLANWRRLDPQNVTDARRKLLDSIANGDFAGEFVPELATSQSGLGDLGARFWEELAYKALLSVAEESESQARDALASLRSKGRFPLAALAPTQDQLSASEVREAQQAIQRVRPDHGAATATRLGNRRFDEAIERLLGRRVLSESDTQWADQVRKVLEGLPAADAETLTCTVTLLPQEPRSVGDDLASSFYRIFGMVQGSGEPVKANLYAPGESVLGRLNYPGPPVSFLIYDEQGREVIETVQIKGPWAPVALVGMAREGRPTAVPIGDGATKAWKVELLVPSRDGRLQLSVWMKLEFQKELPALRDWPR